MAITVTQTQIVKIEPLARGVDRIWMRHNLSNGATLRHRFRWPRGQAVSTSEWEAIINERIRIRSARRAARLAAKADRDAGRALINSAEATYRAKMDELL